MMEERRMKKYIISLVFVLAAGIPVLGQTSYLTLIPQHYYKIFFLST